MCLTIRTTRPRAVAVEPNVKTIERRSGNFMSKIDNNYPKSVYTSVYITNELCMVKNSRDCNSVSTDKPMLGLEKKR